MMQLQAQLQGGRSGLCGLSGPARWQALRL